MNPDATLLRMLTQELAKKGAASRQSAKDARDTGHTRLHDYFDGYADGVLFATAAYAEALGDEGFTEPEPAPYLKAVQ